MPLTPEQITDGWNGTPSARITGDKDRENPVEGAHTAPSGDEVERVARALFDDHWQDDPGLIVSAWEDICDIEQDAWRRSAQAAIAAMRPASGVFSIGDRVTKIKGSAWTGRVVGTYSTTLTPEGYAIESENEPGSVQIYPATALRQAGEG